MAGSKTFARGVVFATIGALLWGFSGACAQFLFANYEIEASFVTMVRSLAAGLMFLAVLFARQRKTLLSMLRDSRTMLRLLVFGVGLFGSQFAFVMSVSCTNAGTATVLQMSGSVFIMVFTCLIARKLPQLREVAGLIAAVAATWLIATQGDPSVLTLPVAGLAWGMMNGLAVALYVMYPKRLFSMWGSFASTGLAMFVCAAIGAVAWIVPQVSGVILGQVPLDAFELAFPALDAAGWVALLAGVGCIGTFVAFGMYLRGVSMVGPVTGGLLGAFEPLGAMIVSAVWLGTSFSGADWAGFALMMVMLVLVTVTPANGRAAI